MSSVLTANLNTKVLSAGIWTLVVAAFVIAMTLTGGISIPGRGMLVFQSCISLIVLALALFRIVSEGIPTRLAAWGIILICCALGLLLLQVVPLPVSLWRMFPERDLLLRNFELIGASPRWSPLSLAPQATLANGISMLPAIAAFLAVLTIKPRHLIWISGSIVGCAVLSVLLGMLQHFQGSGSAFYLYESAQGLGTGIFNNRSFFSAQLYTSIPILSAFLVAAHGKWHLRPTLVVVVGIIYAGIILVGLSLSQSRSGILLAMPAILFAVMLAFARIQETRRGTKATYALLALFLGVLVVGQAGMAGLLRFAEVDPVTDYRTVIAKGSIDLGIRQFPIGSGFGSFVPMYQLHETPEMMRAEYVNHAHNDWLELIVEGGAPALFLLVGFVIWYLYALVRVWRYGQGGQTALFQRMASLVIPLLLIHSLVDFPLRTPTLMVLFALCCGITVLQPDVARGNIKPSRRKQSSEPEVGVSKSFQRPKTGFGAKRPGGQLGPDADQLQ